MRGLRLPEAKSVDLFEIDTPGQLTRKRDVLDGAALALPPSNRYVDFEAEDLETSLPPKLTAAAPLRRGVARRRR
jgi:O-methyltransferase involved in polyketide biosynthesis